MVGARRITCDAFEQISQGIGIHSPERTVAVRQPPQHPAANADIPGIRHDVAYARSSRIGERGPYLAVGLHDDVDGDAVAYAGDEPVATPRVPDHPVGVAGDILDDRGFAVRPRLGELVLTGLAVAPTVTAARRVTVQDVGTTCVAQCDVVW